MSPLITARLRLRLPDPCDAPFFLELLNDPSFVRFTGDRQIKDQPAAERYITERLLRHFDTHHFTLLVVERQNDATPLGICGYVQRDYLEAPDLGFGFLERYCRQGFGYESARAILDHGRGQLNLGRLYGLTSDDNIGSQRLLAKLGFRVDRREQFPGLNHPSLVLIHEG